MGRGAELRVLVTGANGFVGRALVKRLTSETGVYVRAAVRRNCVFDPIAERVESIVFGSLASDTSRMQTTQPRFNQDMFFAQWLLRYLYFTRIL